MVKYLHDTLEQLNVMQEPQEYYAKQEELMHKLKQLPYKESDMENVTKHLIIWENNFKAFGKGLEYDSSMRKSYPNNKKYQKPVLGKRFMGTAEALLSISIRQSLLP